MADAGKVAGLSADIAVVGMAGFFPGAGDTGAYWENILRKRIWFREVPENRWDRRIYYDSDPAGGDRISSKWGAFLPEIAFDPLEYGIPPNSLNHIETSQILVLEAAKRALADAGRFDQGFDRNRTSVFIGTGACQGDLGQHYSFRSMLPAFFGSSAHDVVSEFSGYLPEWSSEAFTGTITNIAAGRVADRLDLGGTNSTIDAACASALAALRAGILELRAKECDMVIAGATDTLMSPYAYTCFSKVGALSPAGKSLPFDTEADGIVLGEAAGALVLKRLEDAEKSGDRIYAVIKGIGSSSDGKGAGLTVPSPEGQIEAICRAYDNSGVDPAEVELLEAHGTATKAGDRAEAKALSQFFSQAGMEPKRCAVGSVKSMIGHSKCAAGIASLIKAVLCLHHKILAPTAGIENPIEEFAGENQPLYLNTSARPWISSGRVPRRAGVSAFGFGGANFHAVLEEYTGVSRRGGFTCPYPEFETELFCFSASSPRQLSGQIRRVKNLAGSAEQQGIRLTDIAFSLWRSFKSSSPARLAVAAGSAAELAGKLEKAEEMLGSEQGGSHLLQGVYLDLHPAEKSGRIAFVFPGQGSQYPGMLNELSMAFPGVRKVFERFERHLEADFPEGLFSLINPPEVSGPDKRRAAGKALARTDAAQAAMGAADAAMTELLGTFGVRPDMAAGHSFGEYPALHAAGVIDEPALAKISAARGRFMLEAAGDSQGAMAAVKAPEPEVSRAIAGMDKVWIANINAPEQTVISGAVRAVEKAEKKLAELGYGVKRLAVSCAFHTPEVRAAGEKLKSFLSDFAFRKPCIPVYSNTTAAPFPEDEDGIKNLLAKQAVNPVRFVSEVEAMYEAGARIFIEVGAGGVLTGLIGRILAGRPHYAAATDKKSAAGVSRLQHALGVLAAAGAELNLDPLFEGRQCSIIDLHNPRKPHERQMPKTAWLVDGRGARPADQPPAGPVLPRQVCFADRSCTDRGRPVSAGGLRQDDEFSEYNQDNNGGDIMGSFNENSRHEKGRTAQNPEDSVIARFQDLMSPFLETQREVMTAYLNGNSRAAAPGADLCGLQDITPMDYPAETNYGRPVSEPEERSSALMSETSSAAEESAETYESFSARQPAAEQESTAVAHKGPAGAAEFDARSMLMDIVSDLSGYPADMLEPDQEIEADLGIDSIKRMQILEALEAELEKYGIRLTDKDTETLAEGSTLGDIINTLNSAARGSKKKETSPQTFPAGEKEPEEQPDVPVSADPAENFREISREKITQQLYSVVENRTGFPAGALAPDLDLEADLEADQELKQQIAEDFIEKIKKGRGQEGAVNAYDTARGFKKLGDLVDWAADGFNRSRTADGVKRYTVYAKNRPLIGNPVQTAAESVILVTKIAGDPLAGNVVKSLRLFNRRVITLQHLSGDGPKQAGDNEDRDMNYCADFSSSEDLRASVERIRKDHGPVAGLMHLVPLSCAKSIEDFSLTEWKQWLAAEVKSLFTLTRLLSEDLLAAAAKDGATLMAATAMGGTFASTPQDQGRETPPGFFPGSGCVAGFLKALAAEVPDLNIRVVDIDPQDAPDEVSERLKNEFFTQSADVEVGYSSGRRLVLDICRSPLEQKSEPEIQINSESRLLVTGGARGITAAVALELAERFAPTLFVVGSSPPPGAEDSETAGITDEKRLKQILAAGLKSGANPVKPVDVEKAFARLMREREIRENLELLRNTGAEVHYFQADVTDEAEFCRLLGTIYREAGGIDGVIHGAGRIEDKMVKDKNPESFDRVFDTKADSLFILARNLRLESLQFFALFSSAAGRFGNAGQSDYGAANEVYNKTAVYLNQRYSPRVVSFIWGPWQSRGMVSEPVREKFARSGIVLIPRKTGPGHFINEIMHGRQTDVEVVYGGFAKEDEQV